MTSANGLAAAGGVELLVDDLGEAAQVVVDSALFDRTAVFKTAYWATEHAFVFIAPADHPGRFVIEVRPKDRDSASAESLARKFCNALIDQQTRQLVLVETAKVRDTLLSKAFAAGREHLDPKKIG